MEILIWGDNMKQQVSVSILLAVIVIVLALIYIRINNETKNNENYISTENDVSKEQSVTISQEYITYPYYIKTKYDRLVVYETKTKEIYMETSIGIESLPTEIKEKLETGIFFRTEAELYDFLESYSS